MTPQGKTVPNSLESSTRRRGFLYEGVPTLSKQLSHSPATLTIWVQLMHE